MLSQAIFYSAWDFACCFSKTYRSASSKSSLLSTRPSLACTRLSRSLITRGSFSKHLVPSVSQPLAFLPRLLACLLFAPAVIHSPPPPCQPQVTAAYSLSNILCIATSPTWESSKLTKQRQAPHINPSGNLRQKKTNTGYWEQSLPFSQVLHWKCGPGKGWVSGHKALLSHFSGLSSG